jgi:hypothetical protein
MGKMLGGGCKQSEREVQEAKKRQILQRLEDLKSEEARFLAQLQASTFNLTQSNDCEGITDKEKTDD